MCPATDVDKQGCSPDYRFKSKCYSDTMYSDSCFFYIGTYQCSVPDVVNAQLVDVSIEKLGDNSRCIVMNGNSVRSARCAETSCDGSNTITYTFANGNKCTCPSGTATGTCTDSSTSVECPSDTAKLCGRLKSEKCPKDCSGRGLCFNQGTTPTCFCVYGFKGSDCSEQDTNDPLGKTLLLDILGYKKIAHIVSLAVTMLAAVVLINV